MRWVVNRALLVLVAGALVAASACKREEQDTHQAAHVELAIENDIQTLDPTALSDPHTSRIVWQIFEGLVGLDEKGNVLPLLAESWAASDDAKRWTFKIRPGVLYHQSSLFRNDQRTRSVVAADIVYSYTRFAKGFGSFVFAGLVEGFDAYLAGKASTVSGFSALDSQTFVIELTRPDPSFLFRITSPYLGIMPREVVEAARDSFGVMVAVGTGPFQFVDRSATELTLDRNPSYWRPTKGNLSRIVFRVEKNPQFRVSQLEGGSFDLIQLPVSFLPKFFEGGRLRSELGGKLAAYVAQTYNVHYLGIDDRQVSDVHLRRAIAQAIDKQAIVNGLLRGMAEVATSPVPPGLQGFAPPTALNFAPDAARRELQQSHSYNRALTLLASDVADGAEVAQLIQSNLKDVGIETAIETVDFNTLISRIFSKDRSELFVAFSEWIYGAPEFIMETFDSRHFPNPNVFGYANREVDEQLSLLPGIRDRFALNARCREIAAMANADAPAVWLYHQRSVFLMNPRVRGFAVNGHQYWQLAEVRIEGL